MVRATKSPSFSFLRNLVKKSRNLWTFSICWRILDITRRDHRQAKKSVTRRPLLPKSQKPKTIKRMPCFYDLKKSGNFKFWATFMSLSVILRPELRFSGLYYLWIIDFDRFFQTPNHLRPEHFWKKVQDLKGLSSPPKGPTHTLKGGIPPDISFRLSRTQQVFCTLIEFNNLKKSKAPHQAKLQVSGPTVEVYGLEKMY